MALGTPAIVVDRLVKHYRTRGTTVAAVRDLSFEVKSGEALALLGRNGAGKSTTVRVLASLLKPDGGRVAIGGYDVVGRPAQARAILGVALQEAGLPRRQTARRLLRHHARLYGMAEAKASVRVGEAIELFGLEQVSDRSISTYSGGERRRLHIALALLHSPRVVLLDEPTAGLDVESCRVVWRELQARLAAGATLLFTTHDLREADNYAHRVAIIDEGRLVAHRCPQELKRDFGSLALTLSFASEREARRALEVVGRGELIDRIGARIAMSGAEEMPRVIEMLDAEGIGAQSASLAEPTLDSIFRTLTAALGDAENAR